MNENMDIFRSGWDKVAEKPPTNRKVKMLVLGQKTKDAFLHERKRIIGLSHTQLGYSAVETIDHGEPLQLDLFDHYLTSKDIR